MLFASEDVFARHILIVVDVLQVCQRDLFQIAGACDVLRPCASPLEERTEHCRQQNDDGKSDHELYKREISFPEKSRRFFLSRHSGTLYSFFLARLN